MEILKYKNGRLIPDPLRGVAGASAGAITALLVSCGYNDQEIKARLSELSPASFFDKPEIGLIPKVVSGYQIKRSRELSNLYKELGITTQKGSWADLLNTAKILGVLEAFKLLLLNITNKDLYKKSANELALLSILYENRPSYLLSLFYDWGFFSGMKIREFFGKCIIAKLPPEYKEKYTGKNIGELRFRDHKKIFGIDLAVTGSNFSTGKSQVFSALTTPLFPVVDAVRISMSIPFIYKPVNIRGEDLDLIREKNTSKTNKSKTKLTDQDLGGVWVDGGYFNNLPLEIFDPNHTLGIQLDYEPGPISDWGIYNFSVFIKRYIELAALGGGNAKISTSYLKRENIITIDASKIGLFDFSAKKDDLEKIWEAARMAVKFYFGVINYSDLKIAKRKLIDLKKDPWQ